MDFNVEQMKAKHRDYVVEEALEVDFVVLVYFIASYIVVREVVDAESTLEERHASLVASEVERKFGWHRDDFHQYFLVLLEQH